MEYIQLSNGVMMPQLGYGTIGQSGEQIISNVAFALNNGYRLIDTANRYGNEVEVGQGLKASGLKRETIFWKLS
ncbi:2,5-diketo-D-gluconic acid reductase A [Clostridiales bacterium CHKCI006]|nr:2,5-diketo-D-gluconic acid reductase A [Clostridiales bacterium CHKCI006]